MASAAGVSCCMQPCTTESQESMSQCSLSTVCLVVALTVGFSNGLVASSRAAPHSNAKTARGRRLRSTIARVVESDKSSGEYFRRLTSAFQGDFDNYNQVVQDRQHGLTPGAGGGHEHIHCTLVPCPDFGDDANTRRSRWVLAAFYFNGNPRQIFRFRAYQLWAPHHDDVDDGSAVVRMKLNTLSPVLEQALRKRSEEPCSWWRTAWEVWSGEEKEEVHGDGINSWGQFRSALPSLVSPLQGCDVLWEEDWDAAKHSYLLGNEYGSDEVNDITAFCDTSFHATMEAGSDGAIVDSISMIPGQRILIKDELSLWEDEFWINDRGYDPDAETDSTNGNHDMPYVYGNRRGVPYKLERVSHIVSMAGAELNKRILHSRRRTSKSDELHWTLGGSHRTPEEYETKLKAIE